MVQYFKSNYPFLLLSIIGIWVLIFSIYDVLFNKEWQIFLISAYVILFIFTIIFTFLKIQKPTSSIDTIQEFEKSLKGGLFHFKCPACKGIFALKKTKQNNGKSMKMKCPDCGAIANMPVHPFCIEEEIPEKKSLKASFKCSLCGEGITVWAEGTELFDDVCVFSCPFCGADKKLNRI